MGSTLKVVKYAPGEGWRSVGLIVWKIKSHLHRPKEQKNMLHGI